MGSARTQVTGQGTGGPGWSGAAQGPPDPMVVAAGIEPQGNRVLQPAHFTVETLEAGMGEVLVYVEDPEGHTEEVGTPGLLGGGRGPNAWAL